MSKLGEDEIIRIKTRAINQNLDADEWTFSNFAAQARASRELRDDMELDAYGLLQAAAAPRKDIDRLTVLLNELKDQQLESYG